MMALRSGQSDVPVMTTVPDNMLRVDFLKDRAANGCPQAAEIGLRYTSDYG